MIQNLFKLLILLQFPFFAQAEKLTFKGDVYDLSGKKKFYDFERYVDGKKEAETLKNLFKDLQGQVVVEEKAQLKKGQLQSYKIYHKQTGDEGEIKVVGKKLEFSYKKKGGSVEKKTESLKDNFIVGMTLVPYLRSHWDSLLKGDSLRTRFGVWYRQETVGFKFWKENEVKKEGKDVVVIVMKPTSFVIRALVDPLYFSFDKKTKELLSLKGRTTPKIQKDGKWEDFDAFIRYSKVL